MYNNVIFVGGIHGVGKGTICSQLGNILSLEHLSASSVIKWGLFNNEKGTKQVEDVSYTQDRLIIGLKEVISRDKLYILDGHYCLLNTDGAISQVPQKTFEDLSPSLLSIVIEDVSEIRCRLEARDGKSYDYDLLKLMQEKELQHAESLSRILDIPLEVVAHGNIVNLLSHITKIYGL